MTIIIPNWHPTTVNQLLGMHWGKASRIKKSDKAIIAHSFRNFPKAEKKRILIVTIILQKGKRAADPDAYHKSLLDALVAAGMLTDDNRQGVELLPIQFERGTETRWGTAITLTDLEGEIQKLPTMYAQNYLRDHRVKPTSHREPV